MNAGGVVAVTWVSLDRLRAAEHGVDLGPLERSTQRRVFHRGGRIELVPELLARDVPRLNERDQLGEFADSVRANRGLVLAFNESGIEYVTVDSLAKAPGLRLVARLHDGAVFGPAPSAATPARPPTVALPSPRR